MNRILMAVCVFLFAASVASCTDAPKVVQGTVVRHDASSRTLVLKDECPPNAEVTIATDRAETGAECQPGDLVRAACRDEGGRTVALRVMNLSRQKELGFLAKPGTRKKCR